VSGDFDFSGWDLRQIQVSHGIVGMRLLWSSRLDDGHENGRCLSSFALRLPGCG
jgi:hypothetical protein